MLKDSYREILEVNDREEFKRAVVDFSQDLGFSTVGAVAVFDHPVGPPEFVAVDNSSAAYYEIFNSVTECRRDPVMQHCKKSYHPIIWDRNTYIKAGVVDKWEQQAAYGYKSGIALALHLPEGKHFFIGVDMDSALPKDSELRRMTSCLQLFTLYAQEVAAQVLRPSMPLAADALLPHLMPTELDTLRWTLEGETPWGISEVMNISESAAVFHLSNAVRKLECGNKFQAAVKARRLKLMD